MRFNAVTAENVFQILDPVGDFQIGLVIRFDGRIQERILEKALLLSLDQVPVIGARFVPGWWRGYWEPLDRSFFKVERILTTSPDTDAKAFFTKPLNHLDGPLVRAAIFSSDTDTLCLNVSHFAADASGVKAYAALLSSIYNRLLTDPGYLPDPADPPSRSLRQVTQRFSFKQKLGIARQILSDLAENRPFPRPCTLPGFCSSNEKRVYVTRRIEKALFQQVQAWSGRHGATINDVLMAAFFRAFAAMHRTDLRRSPSTCNRRMIVTADLRRYLPPDQGHRLISSLSGWVPVELGIGPEEAMEKTCLTVSKIMQHKKQGYLGLGILMAGAVLIKVSPLALSVACGRIFATLAAGMRIVAPSFTNMGRIDPASLHFEGTHILDAFLVPPVVYPPVFGCGVSGFRDTLILSAGICEPGFQSETVEELFEIVLNELATLT
jgi:NRPS condensation-like uncharacterized protein